MTGGIELRFALSRGDFKLDVDTRLAMRGITGIFGPSGAGKTSLLRCIAGLETPRNARLVVDGEVWEDSNAGLRLAAHDRSIGYVFQEPRLFPHLDVRGNLNYAAKRASGGSNSPNAEQIVELLEVEALLNRQPVSLSGGEAQRVAIARALLRVPRILLMDEPVAALDVARKEEILPLLERLHAKLAVPIMYVSHNIEEICLICDQLLVMQEGRALMTGELQDVLTHTEIPGLGGDEAGVAIAAQPLSYDKNYSLTRVRVSGGELMVPGEVSVATQLRLRIRAADVSICREPAKASSILNVLPAVVANIVGESRHSVLVRLSLGKDLLLARITRRSAAELNLSPGDEVFVQIKSIAVRRASI